LVTVKTIIFIVGDTLQLEFIHPSIWYTESFQLLWICAV